MLGASGVSLLSYKNEVSKHSSKFNTNHAYFCYPINLSNRIVCHKLVASARGWNEIAANRV